MMVFSHIDMIYVTHFVRSKVHFIVTYSQVKLIGKGLYNYRLIALLEYIDLIHSHA